MGLVDDLQQKKKSWDRRRALRRRFGGDILERLAAFDEHIILDGAMLREDPPFAWIHVDQSYMSRDIAVTPSGLRSLAGPEGLRILVEEAVVQLLGEPEGWLRRAFPIAGLRVQEKPFGYRSFEPPHWEGHAFVVWCLQPDRFRNPNLGSRSEVHRIVVDVETGNVTAESKGDILGAPPAGIVFGRGLADDHGAFVTAPAPASSTSTAQLWREAAVAEHASIAAFARLTLELLAAAAPLSLIAGVHEAALDEIRHTRECLEQAARSDGQLVDVGPLPALAPRPGTLRDIARRTHDEGVVPESLAVVELRRRADEAVAAGDEEGAGVLLRQALDEERHVQLARDIIAWAEAADR